jgi:hypothetical protein
MKTKKVVTVKVNPFAKKLVSKKKVVAKAPKGKKVVVVKR